MQIALTVSYPLTIDLIVLTTPYSLLATTTMGEREVKTQGNKKESQATSAMGVENAANNGRRTSSRLANKPTTQSGQIGTNVEDIVSSKLVSTIPGDEPGDDTIDESDESITKVRVECMRHCVCY
jgi:predicted HTH transcriptional regulator